MFSLNMIVQSNKHSFYIAINRRLACSVLSSYVWYVWSGISREASTVTIYNSFFHFSFINLINVMRYNEVD